MLHVHKKLSVGFLGFVNIGQLNHFINLTPMVFVFARYYNLTIIAFVTTPIVVSYDAFGCGFLGIINLTPNTKVYNSIKVSHATPPPF